MAPLKKITRGIPFAAALLSRLGVSAHSLLGYAADRKNYDLVFRRAVFLSVVLHLLVFLLMPEKPEEDALDIKEQREVLALSPHVFEVLNAMPRTSLAQKIVKVPNISEVEVETDSIPAPRVELGTLDIGVEVAAGPAGPPGGEGSTGGAVYSRRPELVMLVPPVYPKDAERDRIEGSVELRIHVTENGTVDEVEIVTSSGVRSMDEAAINAARRTRFRPAIQNGRRVAMWINYPIQFALNRR